jgi:hypothetical protein
MPSILCWQESFIDMVAQRISWITGSFHFRITVIMSAWYYAAGPRISRRWHSSVGIRRSSGAIVLPVFTISGMTIPGIAMTCRLASSSGVVQLDFLFST